MPKWAKSLIRLSTFEVETLQKRLAEVVTRRTHCEMKVATLDAEYELECARAAEDASLGHHLGAYKRGFNHRRETVAADLDLIMQEEEGIRDQLGLAFEGLKKFEHVAEIAKIKRATAARKAEDAMLDEVSLRMSRKAS